jgi:hypothetical protein
MSEFFERVRRASRKTPRQIASRLIEMGAERLQRPWARVYPHVLTERALLRAAGAASTDALWQAQQGAPFFVSSRHAEDWIRVFRSRYPDAALAIVSAADRVLRHEFDLLGSGCVGLGRQLPWDTDFKTGRKWAMEYGPRLEYIELDRPSDVKTPWELSRCQHFTTLGQAYWLTGDERYAQEFVDEVSDWIERNPWAYGVNWACAMDVALRAVSWIWGFHFFAGSAACRSRAFRGVFLRALYMHGEYIAGHLERGEVNGNHYLSDAAGLVFVGAFFRGTAKGRRWLAIGQEIVDSEIFKQTSEDGVDFEKSTAYHRLVLELFLTSRLLLERNGAPPPIEWVGRLERMLEFVEAYIKPDGTIPLIGDADDGRVQKLGVQGINDHRYLLSAGAVLFGRSDFKRAAGSFADEAFWLLGPEAADQFDALATATAPVGSKAFDGGGFYVLRTDRAHVFVDCGEVGMHGRGGHGHSDITSLEVWLDGMNLVTDCGAYLYTASREWRNRFRSTAFHNVVQVDDEELSRLISPDHLWQLRDDARPRNVAWRWGELSDYFRGGHDAYARLDPPVFVTREVLLVKDRPDVLIRDSIDGRGSRGLVWRFHLDPSLDAAIEQGTVRLSRAGREAWLQMVDPAPGYTVAIEDGWVSPTYGIRVSGKVVTVTARTELPSVVMFRIGLAALAPAALRTLASALPVRLQDSLVTA